MIHNTSHKQEQLYFVCVEQCPLLLYMGYTALYISSLQCYSLSEQMWKKPRVICSSNYILKLQQGTLNFLHYLVEVQWILDTYHVFVFLWNVDKLFCENVLLSFNHSCTLYIEQEQKINSLQMDAHNNSQLHFTHFSVSAWLMSKWNLPLSLDRFWTTIWTNIWKNKSTIYCRICQNVISTNNNKCEKQMRYLAGRKLRCRPISCHPFLSSNC